MIVSLGEAVVLLRKHLLSSRLTLATVVALSLLLGGWSYPPRHMAGYITIDPMRELQAACATAIARNVHRDVPVIYPSPAYYNPYLRDSFWSALAMGDRDFSVKVLAAFLSALRRDGAPPTFFINAYRFPRYNDDDSGALVLIWAWDNQRRYGLAPSRMLLQRVVNYLLSRDHNGFLSTPPGRYRSWWDAYDFPRVDYLSYTQGLYAVALQAARHLGLRLPAHAIARAEAAYQAFYDPQLHFMRLSMGIAASDASALTGEYLSLWLFHRAMLPDQTVRGTLQNLAPFGAGFRVTVLAGSGEQGWSYFPSDSAMGVPGDYQNGASWLLYDALTIGAAGLHHLINGEDRLRQRLIQEFASGMIFHEYLQTDPSLPYYGGEPPFRDNFSWNMFVAVIWQSLGAKLPDQSTPPDSGGGIVHSANRQPLKPLGCGRDDAAPPPGHASV